MGATGYRATAKEFRIEIEAMPLIGAVGEVVTIKDGEEKRDTKAFMICPVCSDSQVRQFYIGKCGHTPADMKNPSTLESTSPGDPGFKVKDIPDRGRMEGDKIVVMTADEIAEAKGQTLQKNVLSLVVRPAAEVSRETFPDGYGLWFHPANENDHAYAMLRAQAERPGIALVGVSNLNGTSKLLQLQAFQGGLVLRGLLRPEEVRTFEVPPAHCTDQELTLAGELMDNLMAPFDPEEFRNETVAKMRLLIESKLTGTPLAKIRDIDSGRKAMPDAFASLLSAAVAAVKTA